MPFGGGVLRCIGDALASFEMKLVLATILLRYQLALAEHQPERPQRRGITLTPANGVRMRFCQDARKNVQSTQGRVLSG